MSDFGARVGRGVLTLLVTLVIAGQMTGSCSALPVVPDLVGPSSQAQDCADHAPVGYGAAAVEFRRGAADIDHAPAVVGPAASRVGATGRRSHGRRRRRAPPAGRALLQRLCVART